MTDQFRTARLRVGEGPYRKGLQLTTDPAAPSDPTECKGRQPCFVDPGRFATWERSGMFEPEAAEPKASPSPAAPPPSPSDQIDQPDTAAATGAGEGEGVTRG